MINDIAWTDWGEDEAHGTGRYELQEQCTSDCNGETSMFTKHAVEVTASGVEMGAGYHTFTLEFTDTAPEGQEMTRSIELDELTDRPHAEMSTQPTN